MKNSPLSLTFTLPTLTALCIFSFFPQNAFASKPAPIQGLAKMHEESQTNRRTASEISSTPVPLDGLEKALPKKFASPKARNLKVAYDALQAKQFLKAAQAASKLYRDPVFSDVAFWISSAAARGQARDWIENKKYPQALQASRNAIRYSSQLLTANPASPFLKVLPKELAMAEILQGEALWGLRQWAKSQESYEAGLQRLPNLTELSFVGPDSMGRYAESCKKKPGPYCTGWLQKLMNHFGRNSDDLKKVTSLFPSLPDLPHPNAEINRTTTYRATDLDQEDFDAAMKSYLDDKFDEAVKEFQEFLDEYPRSIHRLRARYWLAQALKQKKKTDEAKTVLTQLQKDSPFSFYGYLAAKDIGVEQGLALSEDIPDALDNDPALSPSDVFHLNRARDFIAEHADALAAFELKEIRLKDTLSNSFLVYLAMLDQKAKYYSGTFLVLNELFQRGDDELISSYGVDFIFPVSFLKEIEMASTENDLDPVLILSLMKQESAFDESAISTSGALGLMQLMPATALDTDQTVKRPQLLTPERNIMIGTKYLKKLLTRYHGNIALALASYNAGPNAVARWLKDFPPKKGILEFIELIPYRETREYVAAIIRNYMWYSRKLGNHPPKDFDFFWYPPQKASSIPDKSQEKSQNKSKISQNKSKINRGITRLKQRNGNA